ncbi:MAG TPA: hypothetical protein VFG84_03600 [Gemmatimonadaceae bacterium]|nr:hypothetical protein [Gemmatimonadaceae bacterium]
MRERLLSAATEAPTRRGTISIDLVLLTPGRKQLVVLLERVPASLAGGRDEWSLPFHVPDAVDDVLDALAVRLARDLVESEPTWLRQVRASSGAGHPAGVDVSVGYVGVMPASYATPVGADGGWFPLTDLPPLAAGHAELVQEALDVIRMGVDYEPIAFRLLPATFTLSELQQVYELLLARKLHKASFRRALQAAWLVEPTDEWRSEGRGRPAQLFRFAPRKRRSQHRGVRFDLLAGRQYGRAR